MTSYEWTDKIGCIYIQKRYIFNFSCALQNDFRRLHFTFWHFQKTSLSLVRLLITITWLEVTWGMAAVAGVSYCLTLCTVDCWELEIHITDGGGGIISCYFTYCWLLRTWDSHHGRRRRYHIVLLYILLTVEIHITDGSGGGGVRPCSVTVFSLRVFSSRTAAAAAGVSGLVL